MNLEVWTFYDGHVKSLIDFKQRRGSNQQCVCNDYVTQCGRWMYRQGGRGTVGQILYCIPPLFLFNTSLVLSLYIVSLYSKAMKIHFSCFWDVQISSMNNTYSEKPYAFKFCYTCVFSSFSHQQTQNYKSI